MCLCALEDHFINFFKDQCFHWLDYLCLIWHPFAGTKVTKISKMFAKCEKQSKGSLILRFFLPALVGQDKQALSSSGPLIYHVQSFSFLCISSIWKSSFAFQFCFLFSLCILKKNHCVCKGVAWGTLVMKPSCILTVVVVTQISA